MAERLSVKEDVVGSTPTLTAKRGILKCPVYRDRLCALSAGPSMERGDRLWVGDPILEGRCKTRSLRVPRQVEERGDTTRLLREMEGQPLVKQPVPKTCAGNTAVGSTPTPSARGFPWLSDIGNIWTGCRGVPPCR